MIDDMDRLRNLFRPSKAKYTPIREDEQDEREPLATTITTNDHPFEHLDNGTREEEAQHEDLPPFSWVHYIVFLFLGIAMLWAW